MMKQIKTLCYDMLLDIMDVAEKEDSPENKANNAQIATPLLGTP